MFTFSTVLLLIPGAAFGTKGNHRYPSTIVALVPSVLEVLLDLELSALPSAENDQDKVLLRNFQNIRIPVDLTTNDWKSLLTRAAEYNRNHQRNNNAAFCINLSIYVFPLEKLTESLPNLLDAIEEANVIFDGTVSTIIFQLRYETVPQLTPSLYRDIRHIKNSAGGQLLSIGILIGKQYCLEDPGTIDILDYAYIDVVVFGTPYFLSIESRENVITELVSSFPCLKLVNWRAKVAISLPLQIPLDENGRILSEEALDDLVNFPHGPNGEGVFIIVGAAFAKSETETGYKLVSESKGFERWLQAPTEINKFHLGITLNPSNVPLNISDTFELVSGDFAKILVNVSEDLEQNEMALNKLIELRQRSNKSPRLEATLLIQISNSSDWKRFQNLIGTSLALSGTGNNASAGAVNGIIVEYADCMGPGFSPKYLDDDELTERMERYRLCMYPLLVLNEPRLDYNPSSEVQIGIAIQLQALTLIHNLFGTKRYNVHPLLLSLYTADIIMLQVNVDRESVLTAGAQNFAIALINHMRHGRTVAYSLLHVKPSKVHFYVRLTLCTCKGRNLTELAEYARLFEIINNWAVAENVTIFLDKAFQFSDEDCVPALAAPPKERCLCGWWEVYRNSDVEFGFKVADKKSIARELYERQQQRPFISHLPTPDGSIYLEAIIPTCVIAVGIVVVTAASFVYYWRSKYVLSRQEVNQLLKMLADSANGQHASSNSIEIVGRCHINWKRLQISRSHIVINSSHCLGSGQFGSVHVGSMKQKQTTIPVAVKTVQNSGPTRSYGYYLALKALVSEIKILNCIGEHENIVGLVGACTSELRKGKLFVCLEYCQRGCLRDHLRSCRPYNAAGTSTKTAPINENDGELCQNLYKWSTEIANGMEFIASKNIVHADLSARNVLLTSEKCAKICDFGLSRQLGEYSEYLKSEAGPLPWRWMAPESLVGQIYNEKSDIWAFGVTLWEIFSFGDEPYSGRSWDRDFLIQLESGMRLEKPGYGGKEMYWVMKRCWEIEPSCRPTFTQVKDLIGHPTP